MTAYAVTVKPRTAFSLEKQYGSVALDATAVSDLGALTTSNNVNDVLHYLNLLIEDYLVTTVNSTGKATSVQATTAPSDIILSAATLANGADGSVTPVEVGTFSVTSPIVSTYTYTLVAGTGDTDNASFQISGAVLEYTGGAAAEGTQSVRVRVTNATGEYYEEAFTITTPAP